jgi:hypothetical protein
MLPAWIIRSKFDSGIIISRTSCRFCSSFTIDPSLVARRTMEMQPHRLLCPPTQLVPLLRRPHHHGRDVWPCVLLAGHIVFCTMNRHFMNPQPCDYCKRRLSRSVRLQMGIRSVALYESERLADSAHIRRMKLPDTSDLESDCTTTELQIPNDFCQSTRCRHCRVSPSLSPRS